MVQVISGKKHFLARFQDGFKNNLSSNQLTIFIVENIPEDKEYEVTTNPGTPEYQVTLNKGYYQCVYVMLCFMKEVVFDKKEEQADIYDDPDEDEIEDVKLDNTRERHWRIFLEDNDGGVDNKKALLHTQR